MTPKTAAPPARAERRKPTAAELATKAKRKAGRDAQRDVVARTRHQLEVAFARPVRDDETDDEFDTRRSLEVEAAFADRLLAADEDRTRARDSFIETVRDALDAGLTEMQISKILGIAARSYVYQMRKDAENPLGRRGKPPFAGVPPLAPVIFMRGAKAPRTVWDELERLFSARKWHTTANRTQAWHLARGKTPVIFVDFSQRTADDLKVAAVQAVNKDGDLTKPVLELVNGGTVPMPRRDNGQIDTDAAALLVQKVIGDIPAINGRRRTAAATPGH